MLKKNFEIFNFQVVLPFTLLLHFLALESVKALFFFYFLFLKNYIFRIQDRYFIHNLTSKARDKMWRERNKIKKKKTYPSFIICAVNVQFRIVYIGKK